MTEKKKPRAYAHWGRMLLSLLMAVMMLAGLAPSAAFAAEAEPQPLEQQQLVTPETPAEPETPTEPETPETPDEPEIPEVPEMPETPDTPEVSAEETLTAEIVETAALAAAAPEAVAGTDYKEHYNGCYVYTWRGLQYALYEERFEVVLLENDIDTSSLNNGYGLQKLEGVVDDTICARGSKILNLNNHKINIVFGKSVYQPIRVIASADLTIQNGTITANKRESGGCALIYSEGTLHLEWVDITLTIDNIAENAYSAVMLESLVTHDSTISYCDIRVKVTTDPPENVRPDYLPYAIKVFGEDRLTINGGDYDRVIVYGVPNEKNTGEHHSLLVKGGTFYSFTLFMAGELNGNIQPENPIRIKAAQFRAFDANDTGYGSDNRRLRLFSREEVYYTVKNFNRSKTLPNGKVERYYNKDGIKLADYIKMLYYTFLEPNSLLMFDGKWSDGHYSGTGYLPGIENENLDFLVYPRMSLKANKAQIFSECYGVKDVQLNGESIDYAENYYGSVINCNIDEQLSYQYYELPAQAKSDGYFYKLSYDVYEDGKLKTDNRSIDSGSNPWRIWMPKYACSYWVNFKLNLATEDGYVGPVINSHIVKLNVQKPESTEKAISQIYLRQPGGDLFTGMVTATDRIEVADTATYTVASPGSWTTSDEKTYTRNVTLTAKTGFRFPAFSVISSIPVTVLDSETVGRVTNVAADGKTATVTLTAVCKERLTQIKGTLSGFLDGAPGSGVTIRSNEPEKYTLYISAIQKEEPTSGNSISYTDGSGKLEWGVSYSIIVRVEPHGNYGYQKDDVMLLIARAEGANYSRFWSKDSTLRYDSDDNGIRTLNKEGTSDLRPYYANIEVALPVAGKDARIKVLNSAALKEKYITVDTEGQTWCDKDLSRASTIVAGNEYHISNNLPITLTGGSHSPDAIFDEKWIGVTINGMGTFYDKDDKCLSMSDDSLFTAVAGDGSALWGDLNGDGLRNVLDIQAFYSYLTSGAAPIKFYPSRCDLNGDGKRDVYDLQLLYEVVSGIRSVPTV